MSMHRSRWAAIGAAIAVTLGAGGYFVTSAASNTPSAFVAVPPTRVLDTRTGVGLSGSLSGGVSRKFKVTESIAVVLGDGSIGARTVVPAGATAVVANLTAVSPTDRGFIAIRPGSSTGRPRTSSLNVQAGLTVSNLVTVQLDSRGRVDLFYSASDGRTHIQLDIVGYYMGTDDLFYTRTEIDQALAEKTNVSDVYSKTEVDALLEALTGTTTTTTTTTTVPPQAGAVTVDSVSAYDVAVQVGASGFPILAYGYGIDEIRVAACHDATCSSSTITTIVSGVSGDGTYDAYFDLSMAIGSTGNPLISFWNGTSSDLNLAICSNSSCTSSTTVVVDSSGEVGLYSSIAIGSGGKPIISYFDRTNSALKVAACNDVTCSAFTTTVVDNSGYVGLQTSIAVGADGYPRITYADNSNFAVRLATCSAANCTGTPSLSTVFSAAPLNIADTDLRLLPGDVPVVVFHTSTPYFDIRVAFCQESNCSTPASVVVIDGANDNQMGRNPRLALTSTGRPIVIYQTAGSMFKVALCGDALCSTFSRLALGQVVQGAIGVSPTGDVVLAYANYVAGVELYSCPALVCFG